MIRLKIFSVFVCLIFLFAIATAGDFGEVSPKDKDGNEIKPTINEWGGKEYTIGEGNQLTVDYSGNTVDYSGLDGSVTFSDAGKLVSGTFDVKKEGQYVIGNLEVDLKAGSKVSFIDGELKIEDPGSMMTKEDIGFIDNDLGFDDTSITLSGEGVDFMGASEVSLDEQGYFLQDPQGVMFDDFTVYGKGKVYLLSDSDGLAHVDIDGSYVSVNPTENKFTIGANGLGNSVSVMPNKENKYGLRHDIETDYMSFRSIGGSAPSYISVSNREAQGYVPNVDAVGYFAIDNDGKALYRGDDNKIYNVLAGNVNTEFGSKGTTSSPLEVHMYDYGESELKTLSDYEGIVGFGNDNALGYGFNPTFILGGEYGNALSNSHGRPEGAMLNYGISNTLAYNYNLNEETIEKWFNIRINDRVGYLNDPKNVRLLADTLFRIPKAAGYLQSLNFEGGRGGLQGLAGYSGSSNYINLYGRGGHHPGVLIHEATHIFDFFSGRDFDREWNSISGASGPHTRGYGASSPAEAKATVGEVIFAPDSWWQAFFAGQTGYNNNAQNSFRMAAKIAVLAKHGHISDFDAARILRNANVQVDPKNPTQTYNEVIARVRG